MCPFNAVSQVWLMVITTLLVSGITQSQLLPSWNITIDPAEPKFYIDKTTTIGFNITGPDASNEYLLQIESENINLLDLNDKFYIKLQDNDNFYGGQINATGIFLGKTNIVMKINNKSTNASVFSISFPVKVLRPKRVLDTIFTISVAVLVSLIYINFGCALNWSEIKSTLRRPIGPSIAFTSQFLLMPLLSFGLGKLLFPDDTFMQLGMFFTGVSPGGGASNMWAVILGGNVHLSITMTTISTFAAFGMIPFWVFTLGKEIFDKSNIPVPYEQISTYAIALVVPLFIGYLIQRYLKGLGQFLARILKGFASLLLIFIIVFAIVANLYLFKLFSWQIFIAGLGLPWLGYMLSWIFAKYVCRQSTKDSLTIAIETGIQNTGIAIFLLRFALPQPEADLTTIAPVAVATMTPIPLFICYIAQRIRDRCSSNNLKREDILAQEDSKNYETMTNSREP